VSDSELGGLHRHCYRCFNLKRCNKDGDACGVVSCPMDCGARYHGCKGHEHELLCPLVRVSCINAQVGCGLTLPRKDMVVHLPSCPASLLACTQEWNRWPLHCKERLKTVPFRQRNPMASNGQLDYELALRDQRVAGSLHKMPRRTKLALRNNLTRRFPAMPLPREAKTKANTTDCSLKSLREINRLEVADEETQVGIKYGIAKVFEKNQERQRRRWQDDVDTAILRTGQPVPKKYWEYPEFEKGNIHSHCAYCYTTNCEKKLNYSEGGMEKQSCSMVSCSTGCGAVYHICKTFEHQMLCPTHEDEGEFDWMHRSYKDGKTTLAPKKKKAVTAAPLKPFPSLLAEPCVLTDKPRRMGRIPPPPPPPPNNVHTQMRFDIKMETVTRLQQKPKAMYTFLCGAELRRDQWEGHCKNVHSDIHGGLNNWFEARCPLASYGCGFSSRRLFPGRDPRAAVVYCQATQSFGVRPPPVGVTPGRKGSLELEQLPVEVLQCVFAFLDPWSLGSAALVSHLFRSVASSLLDTRGCVALQWEKSEIPGGGWEVAYMRWFFSPYFNPIEHWGMNSDGAVSVHLQTCPYNIRTEHKRQEKHTKEAKELMKALGVKMKMKQDSEWFIT